MNREHMLRGVIHGEKSDAFVMRLWNVDPQQQVPGMGDSGHKLEPGAQGAREAVISGWFVALQDKHCQGPGARGDKGRIRLRMAG